MTINNDAEAGTEKLTNGGDEVQEALLREEWVLQASEVQLQNPCH